MERGTRLPENWRPTLELRAFAADRGVDPDSTADEFADYWTAVPGRRGVKLDWAATWRNWIRHKIEWGQRRARPLAETFDQRRMREIREVLK